MRLTQLGVSIDATGAIKGAAQTKAALGEIATSATTTTAALGTTSTAATAALGRQASASKELSIATRLTSADIAESSKRYDAMLASMTGAAAGTAQLTDSTRAFGLAQIQAIEIDKARTASQGSLSGALAGSGVQLGLVRRELGTLVGRLTGTNAAVDRLGASFGTMAVGSGPVIGILVGIAAISSAYEYLTKKSKEAEQATQDALKALKDLADQQRLGIGGKLAEDLAKGTAELDKQTKKLRELREIEANEAPDSKRRQLNQERVADAKKLHDETSKNIDAGNLAARKQKDDANKAESSAEDDRLARLVTANKATEAETRSAGVRLQNIRAAISANVASNGDATERLRLIADADALNKALNPVVKTSQAAANSFAGLAAKIADLRTEANAFGKDASIDARISALNRELDAAARTTPSLTAKIAAARVEVAALGATLRENADVAVTKKLQEQFDAAKTLYDAAKAGAANYRELTAAQAAKNEIAAKEVELGHALLPVQKALIEGAHELRVNADAEKVTQGIVAQAAALIAERDALTSGSGARKQYAIDLAYQKELIDAKLITDKDVRENRLAAIALLRDEASQTDRVTKAMAALDELKSRRNFSADNIGNANVVFGATTDEAGKFADQLARALQHSQGLVSTFADVGKSIAAAGKLTEAFSKAQQAGKFIDAAGSRDVGFSGALSGQAGAIGVVSAVAGIVAIATAIDSISKHASDVKKSIEDRIRAEIAFKTSLDSVRASLSGDTLGVALAGVKTQFDALRASAETLYAGSKNEATRARALTEIAGLEAQRVTQLRDEAIATSKAAVAEAQRIDGLNAATAAEAAFQKVRAQSNFAGGLAQRQQALAGDTRGAFVTGQTNSATSATDAAYDLLKAGTITVGMFEAMAAVIRGELSKSIADFDAQALAAAAAVEKANAAQLADLNVRVLAAQGRDVEATQARQALVNARELEGVTDAGIRSQIEYAQALEAVTRANQIIADQAKKSADFLLSVADRSLAAIRRIFPELAAQIDADNKKAAREAELAKASGAAARAALEYLFRLQDLADAMDAAAAATQRAADAAKALASFTSSVEDAYLRSAGKTFEADVKQLQQKRDDQLVTAAANHASQAIVDMINATFSNNYNALVKAQLAPSASGALTGTSAIALGTRASSVIANTSTAYNPTRDVVTRVAGGLTEITAVSWLDLGHAQLAVLLRIEQKIGQTGNVTVSVSNPNGGQVAPSVVSRATIDGINRALGYDLSLDAQRVGG